MINVKIKSDIRETLVVNTKRLQNIMLDQAEPSQIKHQSILDSQVICLKCSHIVVYDNLI